MKRTMNNVEKRMKPYHDLLADWDYRFEGGHLFQYFNGQWRLNLFTYRFDSLTAVFDYLIPIISDDEFLDAYLTLCHRE